MELGKLFVTIAADTKALTAGLAMAKGEIQKTTAGMGAQFKTLGIGMVAVGAAITAAFGYAAKGAMDLESILKRVQIQSGATAKQMVEIKNTALSEDFIKLGKSGSQVANMYNRLASEGYKVAEMKKMLKPITETTIILGTEEGETTKLMLNLMQQYNLAADDMGYISDVLAGALANTSFQGQELAEVMKYAGVAAGELGWSLDGTIPIVDAIIKVTGEASMAGTEFRQLIMKMRDPTKEMTDELAKAGITLKDVSEALKSPVALIELLNKAHESGANFAKMFGARASDAAAVIARQEVPAIIALTEKVNEVGFAHKAVGGIMDTTAGKFATLGAAMQNIRTTVGDMLLPSLSLLAEWIGKAAIAIKNFTNAHPDLTKAITLLGATLGILVGAGGAIILGVFAFGKLQAALATAKIGFLALKTAILSLEIGTGLGLILAAVASFIVAYKTNFLGLKTWADNFWETLKEGWRSYVKFVYDMEANIGALFITAGMAAKESAKNIEAFGNAIEIAKEAGTGAFQTTGFTDLASAIDLVNKAAGDSGITVESLSNKMEALTTSFDLSQKYITDSNQAILNSIQYYKEMISLGSNLNNYLNGELSLLEAGSEEYEEKAAAIDKNVKATNEYKAALNAIIEPLSGLDLIAAKMALLGDSTEDSKTKIILLEERVGLLREELAKAIPGTGLFYDLELAINTDLQAIKELNIELSQTKALANLGSQLEYVTRKFEEGKPTVAGYKEQIGILNKELVIAKDKLTELKPEDTGYYEAKTEVEKYEQSIKDLNIAIDDLILRGGKTKEELEKEKLALKDAALTAKEAGDALKESGEKGQSSWEMLGGTITKARVALSNFTREGLVAAIVQAKMSFLPAIQSIREALSRLQQTFLEGQMSAVNYNALQIYYNRQLNDIYKEQANQISILKMGLKEYNSLMKSMGGFGDLGNNSGSVTIPSYGIGTPSVPKTGLAVVHRGEEINPVGQRSYDQRKNYSSINIEPGAIVIQTPKFSEQDGERLFDLIEKKAKGKGLAFARG